MSATDYPSMWVLTLFFNDSTTTRALRRNSHLHVGRSADYKTDPGCLYIGDLKVPKKYITISVGPSDRGSPDQSPLHIQFDSICTTDVNGAVYKLPSRDAPPIKKEFFQSSLLLRVNANKSDRIKIQLEWIPVNVLAFSKRIMYEGLVQQSPLPDSLDSLIAEGLDIRACHSPFEATHYLTFLDHVDYNLQVAVSRGVPVMSGRWCEFIKATPDDVEQWLRAPREDLYLSPDPDHYSHPDSRRSELLTGSSVVIYSDSPSSTKVARFKDLVSCLGPKHCQVTEGTSKEVLLDLFSASTNPLYGFSVLQDKTRTSELDGFMDSEQLWAAIKKMDVSVLKPLALTAATDIEGDSSRSPQKRKRRRLERVNDTDFFSFTPKSSQLRDTESSPSISRTHEEEQGEPDLDSRSHAPQVEISANLGSKPTPAASAVSPKRQSNTAPKEDVTTAAKPAASSVPSKSSKWIVPKVSLADAIISTKREAEESVKQELHAFDLDSIPLGDHIVIEEFDLKIPPKKPAVSENSFYEGRKNYKTFSKKTPRPHSITRTFIEMTDDTTEALASHNAMRREVTKAQRIAANFGNELGAVSGFDPDASQLFVDESESETEVKQNFADNVSSGPHLPRTLQPPRFAVHDPENDDDGVRFSFSRRPL